MKIQEHCCLCGQPIKGYGNNARPLKDGTCCDECKSSLVIPYRIKLMLDECPDTLMEMAGYVQGDDAGLKNPVILHKDLDWENFKSENLEFCEADDSQYLKYQDLIQENKKKRTIALNPGKHLPPGWV